jgi:hypothetical protein
VSWLRDIRPDKQYETVRKLFYQEQRKRKYDEYKKTQQEQQPPTVNNTAYKKFKSNYSGDLPDKRVIPTAIAKTTEERREEQ